MASFGCLDGCTWQKQLVAERSKTGSEQQGMNCIQYGSEFKLNVCILYSYIL